MTLKRRIIITWFLFLLPAYIHAQISRIGEDIQYHTEETSVFSKGAFAPFWLTNNRYGLSTQENNSSLIRAGIFRNVNADSLRNWRIGYGADLAVPIGMDRHFVLQQLYADVQWKSLRLGIGQKERALELKNQALSSGGLTSGINARPIPQIRLELPDFLPIPGTRNWLAIKGHIAYGAYTDNAWQRQFNGGDTLCFYTANSLYHSKAGFMRIGNTERFPLTLTGGIEMSCQFGGEGWNLYDRYDHVGEFDPHQKLGNSFKDFWNAFIPGGNDVNDGDYNNVAGNQLGSWHLSLDYTGNGWGLRAYAEHFFEDHSQMFWQYGWKDMLYGIEAHLPHNPVVSSFVYEHLRTTDQTGSIYHDATDVLPVQISAIDDYYNHHIYGAWQHAGFTMGSPLLISPLYNGNHNIACYHNRVLAHHFGVSGKPCSQIGYRILFTHEKSLGRYIQPLTDPLYGNFLLLEATYHPAWCQGLHITAAYAQNGGQLIGHSRGGMITLSYDGWINKKH